MTVNGKPATLETKVVNGDVISHTLHRHEPPVTSLPIGVIHEDNDMIVIDKPAGVPVHPAGRYNYNSIVEILRAERGFNWNPLPCNRLDRLTSGVMFIGKHPKAAEEFGNKLKGRTVQKEYIARVKGKFPDGVVVCDQPVLKVSPMLGLSRARASGKDAKSKFRRLAYYPSHKPQETKGVPLHGRTPVPSSDGNGVSDNIPSDSPIAAATPPPTDADNEGYSIVHCLPLTGRTHQLRVHLQFLGHPISNDPIYSNRRVFGPSLGKADSTGEDDKEVIERLSRMGKTEVAETAESTEPTAYQTFQTPPPSSITNGDPAAADELIAREHEQMVSRYLKRKGEKMSGGKCETCGTDLYCDPGVHELGIFLHAVSYADSTGGWRYKSKMPHWGMPPSGMDGYTSVPDWNEEGEDLVNGVGVADDKTALVEGIGAITVGEQSKKDEADLDHGKAEQACA